MIKNYAKDNNIKLIQVPPNGTGEYQPLDRRIFGIVKKKLRAYIGRKSEGQKTERWKVALLGFLNAWNEITEKYLISAWNIPGLTCWNSTDEYSCYTYSEE